MAKFIGVKMIEAVPMTAREANDKGHKIGNDSFEEDGSVDDFASVTTSELP